VPNYNESQTRVPNRLRPGGRLPIRISMSASTITAAKTVIVADDAAFVRDRFQTALGNAGHNAIIVRTGAELLAQVQQHGERVDLIVMDLHLPQGRGPELVKALCRLDNLKAPIVVFSGTIANSDEVRELARLGVAGYINEYTAVQHIARSLAPHLFPENDNRRMSPRVVLGIPVSYRFGNSIAAALTLNISGGGLAVRTTNPPAPGTALKVRFRLPGAKDDIETQARVAWVDRRLGMGVQFTDVPPPQQAAIDEFVENHFFSNRKA
jgi:uncharacterized protein (TIGR02266 family)